MLESQRGVAPTRWLELKTGRIEVDRIRSESPDHAPTTAQKARVGRGFLM